MGDSELITLMKTENSITTIFIAIAFGTSVRDLLRTNAYQPFVNNKKYRVVIFSKEVGGNFRKEFGGDNVFFEKLHDYQPTFTERMLLVFHRALLRKMSRTIALGNTAGNLTSMRLMSPLVWFLQLFLDHTKITMLIGWLYKKTNRGSTYCGLFDHYNPSMLVVTRVLNYSNDYPLLKSAALKSVKAVALVSSWDNLTSKAFFPYELTSLVVWNQVMKAEAVSLYGFDEEKILVSGAPRYDVYFDDSNNPTKQEIFEYYGLSPHKKTILYASGSGATTTSRFDSTSPEADICCYIAEAIDRGDISNAQIIVRLHPQADIDHYTGLVTNYPSVVVDVPGEVKQFHDRYFELNDDKRYATLLKECDVVLNFASTATIDAAVFNTPIICVNFDYRGVRPLIYSPRKIYEFDHYKKLLRCDGVDLCSEKEALIPYINKALRNPSRKASGRERIVKQQLQFKDGRSGLRVAEHLMNILHNAM